MEHNVYSVTGKLFQMKQTSHIIWGLEELQRMRNAIHQIEVHLVLSTLLVKTEIVNPRRENLAWHRETNHHRNYELDQNVTWNWLQE